jgi:dipeptidyl-peptidase-4
MLMKRYYLILFSLLSTSLLAQKNFTLEQVILESSTNMQKELKYLQWIPGTDDFSYVFEVNGVENLIKENAGVEGKETLLSLTGLNVSFQSKGLAILNSIPKHNWATDSTLQFWNNEFFLNYNLSSNEITILNDIPAEGLNADFNDPTKIAYTIGNNLYIADNSEQTQLTNDPDSGIINGQYVHRKEFGIKKGTFWSPKNNYLAFYRKDESMVADYPMLDILKKPVGVKYLKYPMAGMTSEEVTVGVYNLKTGETTWLDTGKPKDQYLTGVTWSPDEKYIFISVLNRDQNHVKLNKYNAKTGEVLKVLIEEKNEKYIEPMTGLIFFEDDPDMFIWTTRRDGWNHMYLYDAQGAKIKQLTKGEWEVTEFDGLSTKGFNIFFTATEQSPIERHYYKIDLDRYRMTRITNGSGTHKVVRNINGTKFLDVLSTIDTSYVVSVLDAAGEKLRTVYTAKDPFDGYNKPKTELFTIKSSDESDLYCRQILPPDFDETKKYPVLVYVYGGPHRQKVSNSWLGGGDMWLYFMAQNGLIVFTLDNRGSAYRGLEFEQITFRHLGTFELEDQMSGLNYLHSLPYVDPEKLGVYGWSYGGFMATSMMTKTSGEFKVGVAGGAVIDWQYYEVMYTERYMDTPETNAEGYEESSLLNYVQNLSGKLLLVHGTSDPTVVWQHTLLYVDKAVELGIEVDYFPYIDHVHQVYGEDKLHLFRKITNYFLDNLSSSD